MRRHNLVSGNERPLGFTNDIGSRHNLEDWTWEVALVQWAAMGSVHSLVGIWEAALVLRGLWDSITG